MGTGMGTSLPLKKGFHLSRVPGAVQCDVAQRADPVRSLIRRSSINAAVGRCAPEVPALSGGLSHKVLEAPVGRQRLALEGGGTWREGEGRCSQRLRLSGPEGRGKGGVASV